MDSGLLTEKNQSARSTFVSKCSTQMLRNPLHFTPQHQNSRQRTWQFRRFFLAALDCEAILGSYLCIPLVSTDIRQIKGTKSVCLLSTMTFHNHKNYNFLDCDWFKKTTIFH